MELSLLALKAAARLARFALNSASKGAADEKPFTPAPADRRFEDQAWDSFPFVFWQQAFLAQEEWWRNATRPIRGMTPESAARVAFMGRQALDAASPSNVPWLNPVIIEHTLREGGANLWRGLLNLQQDALSAMLTEPPPLDGRFTVGEEVAITPGEVVFRNDLMELIQYEPTTRDGVRRAGADRARLDHEVLRPRPQPAEFAGPLSGRTRLHRVHDLLAQSRTRGTATSPSTLIAPRGVMAALDAVNAILPERKVHACGYCIGGTRSPSPPPPWPATTTSASPRQLPRRADRFQRGRRADAVRRREPGRLSRGHDVGPGLARHQADGGRLQAAPPERAHLVEADARISARRARRR